MTTATLALLFALWNGGQEAPSGRVQELLEEARLAFEHADLEAARSYSTEGIALVLPAETADAERDVAQALWELGDLARDSGALEDARRAHGAAVAILTRLLPEGDRDLLRVKSELASTLWESGDVFGGRALDEEVLATGERVLEPDDPFLIAARANLGMTLSALGEYGRGRALQESVVAYWEEHESEDPSALELARSNLAATLEKSGELEAARTLQELVLDSREERLPEHHPLLSVARENLGVTLASLGEYAKSRALFEAALTSYEATLPADHPGIVHARSNLAAALVYLGELGAAQSILERALEAQERVLPEEHPALLQNRMNYGACLARQGDHAGARAVYESVLSVYERSLPADHPDVLTARNNLGAAMRSMGDLGEALALNEEVLELRERALPDRHFEVVQSRVNLAASLWQTGELDSARELFEDALEVWEADLPPGHPSLTNARNNLAMLLLGVGEAAEACELLEVVLRDKAARLDEHDAQVIHARSNLALALAAAGDPEGARRHFASLATGILGRLQGLHDLSPREANEQALSLGQDLYATLSLSESDEALARVAFEVAETRRYVSLPRVRGVAESPEVRELREQVDQLGRRLNDLVAARAGGDSRAQVKLLTRQRDLLGREISRRRVAGEVYKGSVRAPDVAASLEPGEVAVAFLRYRRFQFGPGADAARRPAHLLAHAVVGDGTLQRIELGRVDALQPLVDGWRESVARTEGGPRRGVGLSVGETGASAGREREAGGALRAALLDPILDAVTSDDVATLLVCPDDLVYFVPLDALPVGDGRIGDRYRVVQLTSLADLVAPRSPLESEPGLVAVGGVRFDGGDEQPGEPDLESRPSRATWNFAPLVSTREEVLSLAELYRRVHQEPAVLLTGGGATKEALRSRTVGARYLHVATHGWYQPERVASVTDDRDALAPEGGTLADTLVGLAPMTLCGLALAGANEGHDSLGRVPGILTAEELSTFDLSACQLAVLSACETNVGVRRSGVGIQSLQAALHAAGARSSVTSLWPVGDVATRRLMELFYARLWTEGRSASEALWQAKLALREDGHPVRDWAAWVLTGETD